MEHDQQNKDDVNPILRTVNLSRVVGNKKLVDNISLEVFRGAVMAIVGSSGAGKSSFLRLLNRLDEPTNGTVYLQGTDYRTILPRKLRERVGMVMQAPYLFPGSVAENIRFGPRQRGEVLADEQIEQILDRVGLGGYEDQDTNHLSGGEAQRVSLARTLANSPDFLLLDEPTSALDDAAERSVEELLLQIISEENLTCLIVTHDMAQAARLAKQAVLIDSGRLVRVGAVEEIIHA
jgi:putative ABC transport system ATP-binding protein